MQFNRQTEVAARSGSANVQRKYKVAKQEHQQKKREQRKTTTTGKKKEKKKFRNSWKINAAKFKANATGRMIDAAPKSMQGI